jgi:hypothetical protein
MMKRRSHLLCAMAVAITALPVAGASAQQGWTVPADVLGDQGDQHIDYPPWQSDIYAAPWILANAVGDVNGDTLEDIGAGFGDGNPYSADSIYITFSTRLGGVTDALGADGFKIVAEELGAGLASAGDVNGDGQGDVAIMERDKVSVVFGKRGGDAVDTRDLGTQGFTIQGAFATGSSGANGVLLSTGVVPMGDLNGDGVGDLLVGRGGDASIVYPPRAAAGMSIDGRVPGAFVSTITASGERRLDQAVVDKIADLDGDGRDDVLIAGEEWEGTDQAAYGVVSPPPGRALDLAGEVAAGRAFELRTHDGRDGSHGEFSSAISLGDQNGDGREEVGMLDGVDGRWPLRVAFGPPLGQTVDIGDLGAVDSRGYRFHSYGTAIDVGDQNADGRGDFSSYRYVYFSDPALEYGDRQPVESGFYFEFDGPNFATVAAPLRDLNGDRKPELIVARANIHDNSPDPYNPQGQNATYSVDVFDSAIVPDVPLPDPPAPLPDGTIELPIDLGTGAGSRGGASLGVHPGIELAGPGASPAVVADGGVIPSGGQTKHVALRFADGALVPGREYRVRYVAGNGRGLAARGPWRSFVFRGTAAPGPTPAAPRTCRATKPKERRGTQRRDRMIGTSCADRLLGLGGNDSIKGKGGRDVMYGGPGRDRIYARDGKRDVVHCGRGRDAVRADRADRLVGCERKLR